MCSSGCEPLACMSVHASGLLSSRACINLMSTTHSHRRLGGVLAEWGARCAAPRLPHVWARPLGVHPPGESKKRAGRQELLDGGPAPLLLPHTLALPMCTGMMMPAQTKVHALACWQQWAPNTARCMRCHSARAHIHTSPAPTHCTTTTRAGTQAMGGFHRGIDKSLEQVEDACWHLVQALEAFVLVPEDKAFLQVRACGCHGGSNDGRARLRDTAASCTQPWDQAVSKSGRCRRGYPCAMGELIRLMLGGGVWQGLVHMHARINNRSPAPHVTI